MLLMQKWYAHAESVCEDSKPVHLGLYDDLYVQSNTLFLADEFEKFEKICLKIYKLDLLVFLLYQD